ncbi:hypothetical protein KS4_36800 [Poriferisphaera corsica]|uniref:NfeD-like C-terminal domain-containing protein n=1 Tax=Poriferisphaera corsica TaxID=2528020 RepID=A0A517YZD8_9BACT|nr:hypothetical protein [Poriferisphaera corsica]QDU35597.1 hypothetical protein KS4_36800 [Poriferisphaera corsica]
MREFILDFVGWDGALGTGTDAMIYFSIAMFATILFGIRMAMMMLGGDTDTDLIGGDALDAHDIDAMDTGESFNVFSLLSITAFFMGTGWMGLAARISFGLSGPMSLLVSVGFGMAMMLLSTVGIMYVKRLEGTNEYDVKTGIGRTAKVYLTIPGGAKGMGQIEISISGRRKVMKAMTKGETELNAFDMVEVIEVGDDEVFWVKPCHEAVGQG